MTNNVIKDINSKVDAIINSEGPDEFMYLHACAYGYLQACRDFEFIDFAVYNYYTRAIADLVYRDTGVVCTGVLFRDDFTFISCLYYDLYYKCVESVNK